MPNCSHSESSFRKLVKRSAQVSSSTRYERPEHVGETPCQKKVSDRGALTLRMVQQRVGSTQGISFPRFWPNCVAFRTVHIMHLKAQVLFLLTLLIPDPKPATHPLRCAAVLLAGTGHSCQCPTRLRPDVIISKVRTVFCKSMPSKPKNLQGTNIKNAVIKALSLFLQLMRASNVKSIARKMQRTKCKSCSPSLATLVGSQQGKMPTSVMRISFTT